MSMERQFKSAKLQVTMVGDQHPKGVNHLFNNVSQQLSNDQITSLTKAVAMLTSKKVRWCQHHRHGSRRPRLNKGR